MHPELFRIPFTELTVKSYGFMLVVGFLAAVYVIRRLSRNMGDNPEYITNAGLYAIIVGIVGARLFYVIHYWDEGFKDNPIEVFYIWQGGLELLGGVIPAVCVIIYYLRSKRLAVRRYIDILAIGLTLALAFGRIGCLLNGCCYGKPADLPWAVSFPYGSIPYNSQALPDEERGRGERQLELPSDFYFKYFNSDGQAREMLVPKERLTLQQREYLEEHGLQRCLPVHPTQIYSSFNGLILFVILYLFWRRGRRLEDKDVFPAIHKPGTTFGLMFVLYGVGRFVIEIFRDDNPYEVGRLTISQLIGIGMVLVGMICILIFTNSGKVRSSGG